MIEGGERWCVSNEVKMGGLLSSVSCPGRDASQSNRNLYRKRQVFGSSSCFYFEKDTPAQDGGGVVKPGEELRALPDGNMIVIGSERFRAAEVLFEPSLIGRW